MSTILIVEDEKDIAEMIKVQLELAGFPTQVVSDGKSAKEVIESDNKYSLYLIDWMLPHFSGVELCRIIRNQPKTKNLPIMMITALTQPENIVAGLDAGADDYITKPFNMSILLARVRAQMRRPGNLEKKDQLSFEDLHIDLKKCEVKVAGELLALTNTEYQLLCLLSAEPGHVFTREQLINKVQGENTFVSSRTVDTHIAGLRKKLMHRSHLIETIRGIGYRFGE
jgi:two-component system phosphate regulon response regulator PhoB